MAIVIRIETADAAEAEELLRRALELIQVELSTGEPISRSLWNDSNGNTVGTVSFEDSLAQDAPTFEKSDWDPTKENRIQRSIKKVTR